MRKNKLTVKRGSKALEISMRDVLDGLEEAVNYSLYQSEYSTVQILSIEEAKTKQPKTDMLGEPCQITNIYSVSNPPLHRSKDVVSFLFEREKKRSTLLTA